MSRSKNRAQVGKSANLPRVDCTPLLHCSHDDQQKIRHDAGANHGAMACASLYAVFVQTVAGSIPCSNINGYERSDMHILILGGTVFLGRHIAEQALARGHTLTLFNRGQHNADLFSGVEILRGDRNGDHSALYGRHFDAVIDTSGYTARQMQAMVAALGPQVPYYLFISSISAYGIFPPGQHFDESGKLASGEGDYASDKARSEEVLAAAWPGRVALVRPGLIVGPHDPTNRFAYWPRRVAQGGSFIAPGNPARSVQWIDVRDLAAWCLHLCEHRISGSFNAAGPENPASFEHLLARCRAVSNSNAEPLWLDDATLLAHGVVPWTGLPLWIPQDDAESGGMMLADNRRALAHGLKLRPLDETIAATLAWDLAQQASEADLANPRRAKNLTAEHEAQLLARFMG